MNDIEFLLRKKWRQNSLGLWSPKGFVAALPPQEAVALIKSNEERLKIRKLLNEMRCVVRFLIALAIGVYLNSKRK